MGLEGRRTVLAGAEVRKNRIASIEPSHGLADSDKRFPRYPSLPVLRCDGFTKVDQTYAARPADPREGS